jgi:hypothetical protein
MNSTQTLSVKLAEIRRRPLALMPDFLEVAERWENWWNFKADRPLLIGYVSRPGTAVPLESGFNLLDQPARYVASRRAYVESKIWLGDTIPSARIELGPVALGGMLGAPLKLMENEGTSWQDPIIHDWDNPPPLSLDPDNRWFKIVSTLADALAQDAAGHYAVMPPELGGALDVLSNLRDPNRLCLDVLECPEKIKRAAMQVVESWQTVFSMQYQKIVGHGAVPIQWLGCWSDRPYAITTCDFNYMISPEAFVDICMPSIHEQAARVGRSVFHLDGAPRHVQALIDDPAITAIQYSPGDGTPSALAYLDMFKRIQAAGKPVIVTTGAEEVKELVRNLDKRGLVFRITPMRSQQMGADLLKILEQA